MSRTPPATITNGRTARATPRTEAVANPTPRTEAVANPEPAAEKLAIGEPTPAPSAGPTEVSPARPINFGLDDRFLYGLKDAPGPRRSAPAVQQQLDVALSADDVRRGRARGNALLGFLTSATRAGSVNGNALVRVTVGADGSVTSVELAHGSESEWAAVLASFRARAAHAKLRVPAGARGLSILFRISAGVKRVSGKEQGTAVIGVDAPSADDLSLRGDFDVADAAGSAQRMVHTGVVSEEVLRAP